MFAFYPFCSDNAQLAIGIVDYETFSLCLGCKVIYHLTIKNKAYARLLSFT